MFVFLLQQCFGAIQCKAPLKHADPIPNARLRSVSLIISPGISAPSNLFHGFPKGDWVCDSADSKQPRSSVVFSNNHVRRYVQKYDRRLISFPPNCESNEILVDGQRDVYDLGADMKSYYIDKLKFIPLDLDPSFISARSANDHASKRSAQTFLSGMFPPHEPNEKFKISMGMLQSDVLAPSNSMCKEIKSLWSSFKKSDEFIKRTQEAQKILDPLYNLTRIAKSDDNWLYFAPSIFPYTCNNKTLPSAITDQMIDEISKNDAYYTYGFFNFQEKRAGGSALWRKLLSDIDKGLSGISNQPNFRLYFGTQFTIPAILSTLGYKSDVFPSYSSHIAIEIWEKESNLYIRVVFNGDEVKIINSNKSSEILMEFVQFRDAVQPYLRYCEAEFLTTKSRSSDDPNEPENDRLIGPERSVQFLFELIENKEEAFSDHGMP